MKSIPLECRSCTSDFVAVVGTREYQLQICYRCFLNGMAEFYLNESQHGEDDLRSLPQKEDKE